MESMQRVFQNCGKVKDILAHSAKVHSVAWSCDGRKLASGSFDKTVSIFSLDRERLVSFDLFTYPLRLFLLYKNFCKKKYFKLILRKFV